MGVVARMFAVLILAVPLGTVGAASETRYTVPPGDSPSIGDPGAPVVIVEFIDYQ